LLYRIFYMTKIIQRGLPSPPHPQRVHTPDTQCSQTLQRSSDNIERLL